MTTNHDSKNYGTMENTEIQIPTDVITTVQTNSARTKHERVQKCVNCAYFTNLCCVIAFFIVHTIHINVAVWKCPSRSLIKMKAHSLRLSTNPTTFEQRLSGFFEIKPHKSIQVRTKIKLRLYHVATYTFNVFTLSPSYLSHGNGSGRYNQSFDIELRRGIDDWKDNIETIPESYYKDSGYAGMVGEVVMFTTPPLAIATIPCPIGKTVILIPDASF
jgi:hypothetical protein